MLQVIMERFCVQVIKKEQLGIMLKVNREVMQCYFLYGRGHITTYRYK